MVQRVVLSNSDMPYMADMAAKTMELILQPRNTIALAICQDRLYCLELVVCPLSTYFALKQYSPTTKTWISVDSKISNMNRRVSMTAVNNMLIFVPVSIDESESSTIHAYNVETREWHVVCDRTTHQQIIDIGAVQDYVVVVVEPGEFNLIWFNPYTCEQGGTLDERIGTVIGMVTCGQSLVVMGTLGVFQLSIKTKPTLEMIGNPILKAFAVDNVLMDYT